MKGLQFTNKLRYREDLPDPELREGEALLATRVAGICNTDLEIERGYFGFQGVLGHEFVATVERCPGKPEWEGRRVVGEINAWCGECPACRRGDETHCPRRTTLGILRRDGAMATHFTLPHRVLLPVPEDMADEVAVFTEPLAAACEITNQVSIRPTDRVVILGDGKLGLLIAQVLRLTGCQLELIGRHPEKLAMIAAQGTKTWLAEEDVPAGADVVVEVTGNAEGFGRARSLVRPRGTLVLKSTFHGSVEVDLSMLVVDEITLVGSRCGPFGAALRLLRQGLVDVRPMIHGRYPLREGLAAFEKAKERGVLKVLLDV